MFKIDSFVLYVTDVSKSKHFYASIFECEPNVLSPTFVALDFADNVTITLKQRDALTPKSTITGGGTELSMPVTDKSTLDELYQSWIEKGVEFVQHPESSVFGVNFVAVDPDGHRIRVFAG